MTKTAISSVLRNKAVLSHHRLTLSQTEVEFWEYTRGFLEHSREVPRHPRDENAKKPRRRDNMAKVRNTVRRLVNSNVTSYGFEAVFLTFTYRENQSDIDTAWSDWHAFMRRMKARYGNLKYLAVMEFQKRGAVHFHTIFFNLPPTVEKNERKEREVAALWSHGFVDIERIRSAKNVGAYVCKYLNKSADDERLIGKKFFTTSRGLLRPVVSTGEFAKNRMLGMLESEAVELQETSTYEYGGMPVKYYNYKRIQIDYGQNRERCRSVL